MTTAEVLTHPGHPPCPRMSTTEQDALTVTQDEDEFQSVPIQTDDEPIYTAAEVIEVVLAAYERGRNDAASQAGRDRWNRPELIADFRAQRIAAEIRAMCERAASRYLARGLPDGYDYKGGPVDYETGMPPGTACAWLRRQRACPAYELAGGGE